MAQENLEMPAEIITGYRVQTWPDLPGFVVLEIKTGLSQNPAEDAHPPEYASRQLLIGTFDANELGHVLSVFADLAS